MTFQKKHQKNQSSIKLRKIQKLLILIKKSRRFQQRKKPLNYQRLKKMHLYLNQLPLLIHQRPNPYYLMKHYTAEMNIVSKLFCIVLRGKNSEKWSFVNGIFFTVTSKTFTVSQILYTILTELTTPLNNADQGETFFIQESIDFQYMKIIK